MSGHQLSPSRPVTKVTNVEFGAVELADSDLDLLGGDDGIVAGRLPGATGGLPPQGDGRGVAPAESHHPGGDREFYARNDLYTPPPGR